jgi:hypothetical protein
MRQICIPFSDIADNKQAEVEIRIPDTGEIWRYRLESIQGEIKDGNEIGINDDIAALQKYINAYNTDWELIQIFDKNHRTGNIHLLYREREFQDSSAIISNSIINK